MHVGTGALSKRACLVPGRESPGGCGRSLSTFVVLAGRLSTNIAPDNRCRSADAYKSLDRL